MILKAGEANKSKPIRHIEFDINLIGDCDTIVAELCRRANWDFQHDMISHNQEVDVLPCGDCDHQMTVKYRSS